MNQSLKKLRIILQSNYFYALLVLLSIVVVVASTRIIKYKSVYNIAQNEFYGVVKSINIKENYITFIISGREKLLCNYYFKDKNQIINLSLGDSLKLTGSLSVPKKNSNFNLFNYKKYLYNEKIYYILNVNDFKIVKNSRNPLTILKNKISRSLNTNDKADNYIRGFILGDSQYFDKEIMEKYRKIGISHLFSISGMHISSMVMLTERILRKFKIKATNISIICIIFVLIYMYLTSYTSSVMRSGIFFIVLRVVKILRLKISTIKCCILSLFIAIMINPFIVYKMGFIYSFVISFYLICFRKVISNKNKYISKILITSFISWIVSIPISTYFLFNINILTPIYNVIVIPIVTFLIFPLSFLTFVFKQLKPIYLGCINLLEFLTDCFCKLNSNIILKKPNLFLIIVYFIIITFILYRLQYNDKKYIVLLVLMLLIHYNYNYIFKSTYLLMLDVNQADCFVLHNNNITFMIDTGGRIGSERNISDVLKSFGIRKINYIFITHGDYDHMGGAINLVNNFKVDNVIFNCGEFNELEKELIKVLKKKKIKYYSCIKELNIDNNKLYFLQTKEYDNENDNSNVIYTELNDYKFLFMGDAGIDKEKDILKKYNLKNIDFFKVGHHGSNTSSSEEFINSINPKYSLISVGKNNRYGHPNKEVLENLKDSKIYRTDQDGSIMFKIKNNKLKIETCSP